MQIANTGYPDCFVKYPEIAKGANIVKGVITYKSVADAFSLPYKPLSEVIG